ncbi:MAG TPA: Mur ligase family protein [Labilithrix sp.]|nr:Mur ligase family protein [Labilithrix sp.]
MSSGLASALSSLYGRVPLGMRLGLEPMREACARAGHPEQAFDVVHVAGTNGKGSTCAMVASMARAAGVRTGLYTSPHLVRFAERIRIDGEPIDDDALTSVLDDALRIGSDLSFFETATLAAFLAFRAAGVRLAVIEVGIGGRLDATNVIVAPKVTAITGVAFDHQDKLGDTLAAIASEKAAIAKPGVPLVLGVLPDEARRVAVDVATEKGARIVPAIELSPEVSVALAGPHQRSNARVAWTIGAELGFRDDVRARGLSEVTWPGRLERVVVREGELAGPWILDGAHNPDGAEALSVALAREHVGAVVFGALADKSWREMLPVIARIRAPRFYVAPAGRAPADPARLAEIAPGTPAASLRDALVLARGAAGSAPVVVAGSLYLVGEARACLLGLVADPIVAL